MNENDFAKEDRALVALCASSERPRDAEDLLGNPLNWHYLLAASVKHKVCQLLWHQLIRWDLVDAAIGGACLGDTQLLAFETLASATEYRNRRWLEEAERILLTFEKLGIPIVPIKGGALVGDVYTPAERYMNDLDFLIPRSFASDARSALFSLDYRHGRYEPANQTILRVEPAVLRAWTFQNHVLPNFYRVTHDDRSPYCKVQLGHNLFDPYEGFELSSDELLRNHVRGSGASMRLTLPASLLSIITHIYREGTSLVFHEYNIAWQLSKVVDVQRILERPWTSADRAEFRELLQKQSLSNVAAYALRWVSTIFPEGDAQSFARTCEVDEVAVDLDRVVDGTQETHLGDQRNDRFFSLRPPSLRREAGWNRNFSRLDW